MRINLLKYCKSVSYIFWAFLFIYFVTIKWFSGTLLSFHSQFPMHWANQIARQIASKIALNLGESMYVLIFIALIIITIRAIFDIFKNGFVWKKIGIKLAHLLFLVCKWWLVFELIWGLGYNQPAPPSLLHFKEVKSYSVDTLDIFSIRLIHKLNTLRAQIVDEQITQFDFEKAVGISTQVFQQKEHLRYPVIKKALFPRLGDYIGYTAFYQPFTGEAIVRADIPSLELPFTMLHELAHQNGAASEQTANFVAFIIAKGANDPIIQYSMYLQLFTYAQHALLQTCLYNNDVERFKKEVLTYKNLLSDKVKEDRKKMKAFWKLHSSMQIEASEKAFDQFLKWHQQNAGIQSYNEVILWIMGYEQTFGNQF